MGMVNINTCPLNTNGNKCKELFLDSSGDNRSTKIFSVAEIDSGLLLCGASMVTDNTLKKYNVTCVISVSPELPQVPLPNSITRHYTINVRDTIDSNLGEHFDSIADIINQVQEEGGVTLVHCVAGVSRSASLCIAYLIKYKNMTLNEAYWYVHSKRRCIRPNNSFFNQLIDYEEKLTGVSTVKMVYNKGANGVIPDLYESMYLNTTNYTKRFIGTN
ncbi:dual specificity protein phosphatase 14-like [Cimex lectularius]|uniref:Protein-tyrosine-phosphatase n=1 Tax=Cimex lectularius TaxID=79782 RepID=A0A8I6SF19_CIMLE|nr:dual specificity protein phosphatase 14-like [Cimex lectularius]XP_024080886.1 dual specificity protein phosphatase 14-like [Cimex lectularius]XP_024080888.1 dual specificity protein phosphatase 14-like [Cimex lectularius]XP_024080890.1 dual specificity protein phosphatase 14-like [Cimex lectularius]XP_024080893.1 dual specificity protein phosphatase 14-like [Cimex lectularius]XP_024080897.1 dual specificity protein phosphatase 14-like [Cimex lectularius]